VGSSDYKVYALDVNTGAKLWSFATHNGVDSSPAVANGVVYVGSDDYNVYALKADTGVLLWSYATGGPVVSSPAVANGMMYVGSDDGNIYAFGLPRGDEVKQEAASKRPDPKTLRPYLHLKALKCASRSQRNRAQNSEVRGIDVAEQAINSRLGSAMTSKPRNEK
jgi:outer membrane protein assembly factor BamB